MANRNKRKKLEMSSRITPRTAITAAVIVMCRQSFRVRLNVAWDILIAKHAKKTASTIKEK
jgi:hypothetical protein